MKVLLDINVLLDVLLSRDPHLESSASVWAAVERGRIQGFVSAHAITTIYYLAAKQQGAAKANLTLSSLLKVFEIAPVTGEVIRQALSFGWRDFEDAVSAAAAQAASCDAIVTRDPKGFRGSSIRVLTPEAAAGIIRAAR